VYFGEDIQPQFQGQGLGLWNRFMGNERVIGDDTRNLPVSTHKCSLQLKLKWGSSPVVTISLPLQS
jgi:hypothetical protein